MEITLRAQASVDRVWNLDRFYISLDPGLERRAGLVVRWIHWIAIEFEHRAWTFQGLLPDRVLQTQLGVASSAKTFMDMLALIIASLLAGRMLDSATRNPISIMLVVMGLLAVSAAVTILGV